MARIDRGFKQIKLYLDPILWAWLMLATGNASEFLRAAVDEKVAREFPNYPDIGIEEAGDDGA